MDSFFLIDRPCCLRLRALLFLLVMPVSSPAQESSAKAKPAGEVQRFDIDPDRAEFDTDVQFAFAGNDRGWAIWKAYLQGRERVCARAVSLKKGAARQTGPIVEISESTRGIFGLDLSLESKKQDDAREPVVASWSQIDENGVWKIGRFPFANFDTAANQFLPSDSLTRKGMRPQGTSQALVWQELSSPGDTVIHWQHASHGEVFASGQERGALRFHPSVCRFGENRLICFWDEYENGSQWISAREFYPEKGETVRISPPDPGSRCLNPIPLESSGEGLCVAWIKLCDAIGGEGVIDMVHTAHVAFQNSDGAWQMVTDEKGNDEGAAMLNGLLPDLRPGKGYPSGYSGNRRKPMLLDAGDDGVWLLWERKSKHSGGGTKTAGQLLGRRFQNGKWVEGPLLVYDGLIDYRLASPRKVRENGFSFFVVGSEIPRGWKRPSYLVEIDLQKAVPIELDDWRDQFEPAALPYPEKERYTAESDGKKYQLYWGDLHCHSGLTGDAEGEPDEILLYGRDRAKLDVMVLQDNDEVHGRILTEGEYQTGVSHSQWITEPGKFVALPGYEWTQRTTLKGVPFPYQPVYEQRFKGGFPNHRTVIYPMTGGPIVRYFEVGHQFGVMADRVHAAGGILHSQHPAFHISDHPAETNLEVTACWGIYIRSVPVRFHAELDKGRRMGFIGTSDSHRRNPGLCGGLTGIYAEELTPAAIFEALKAHRVFATNGSKIVLDSRADGRMPDQVVEAEKGKVQLNLRVQATAPIVMVRLIGTKGKTLARFEGNGESTAEFRYVAEQLEEGSHWFYWAVEQEGSSKQYAGNISIARGSLAWSSPHFVEVP